MDIAQGELRRLGSGPGVEDAGQRPFLVRVRFCALDAVQVVAAVRAVLRCVVERAGDWPAFEQWPGLLPTRFVQQCAPERNASDPSFDVEAWQGQWRAMSPKEKAAAAEGPWTLSGWLYYFDPTDEGMGDDRQWWWWDAGVEEPGAGWIQVATTGWPFGSGPLTWVIKACGGEELDYGA